MKQSQIFKSTFIVVLISICSFSYAQTGKITGKITDKKTGETLVGLSVKLKGDTKGASTNIDGKYVIASLTAGRYTLDFSYLGYTTKSVAEIDVKAGEVTNLDIVMEEAAARELSAVVVTSTANKESTNSLYAAQKNNSRVSDGISAETIRRSPDKNTSDVLKRISGTTIQDNKFVVVRGLSDRYNTAQLDNSPLPSTEPNRKAFSFDIVPSNLVDNIVINKTATPDLQGDFAGGSIQIITKDIPAQNFVSFGLGYGYNTRSTFKDFQTGYRNATDYLGFDNGLRSLAANFPSTRAVGNGLTASRNIAAIRSLNNDWSIHASTAMPNQNYQFTIGRAKTFEKSDNKLGAILSLTYRNSQQINSDVTHSFHVYNFEDQQDKFSTNIGAIANFAYTYGKSKITLKNLYNRIFDDQFTFRTGTDVSRSADIQFYAFDLIQKSLMKSTLDGEHALGRKNSKIKWTLGYSNVINDQPDQRKLSYSKNYSDAIYTANITSLGKENTRLFSYLNEDIYSADLSFSKPFTFLKKQSMLKVGAGSQYRTRDFDVRFIGLELDSKATDQNSIRARPINTLFGSDLVAEGAYNLKEIPNDADRYTGNAKSASGYIMLDNRLSDNLRLVWGVRAEKYMLDLSTYSSSAAPVSLDNFDLLPSANLSYALTPKSNLRLSYYRTLARPEFRELAPFSYYDYELLAIQYGNPNLKRSLIDNADIRYELFPSSGEVFSISGFYKKFTNAIESSIYDVNSTPDVSYFNAKVANTYGLELEFRKVLSFIGSSDFFKNTTAYTNLSIIKSKVKNLDNPLLLEKERPLVGQSPYVINAGLQHAEVNNKLNLNLLYNRIGRRIYKAGGQNFPSVWEAPRDVLDFQMGYKVLKNKAEIKLNASDLLSQSNVLYFDYDKNKKYSLPGDQTVTSYKPGSTFTLSFSYSL